MKKRDLLKFLEPFDDDIDIVLASRTSMPYLVQHDFEPKYSVYINGEIRDEAKILCIPLAIPVHEYSTKEEMSVLRRGDESASEKEALRRYEAGETPRFSTGICDSLTCGYGELYDNGYWEFPLYPAEDYLEKLETK